MVLQNSERNHSNGLPEAKGKREGTEGQRHKGTEGEGRSGRGAIFNHQFSIINVQVGEGAHGVLEWRNDGMVVPALG